MRIRSWLPKKCGSMRLRIRNPVEKEFRSAQLLIASFAFFTDIVRWPSVFFIEMTPKGGSSTHFFGK